MDGQVQVTVNTGMGKAVLGSGCKGLRLTVLA